MKTPSLSSSNTRLAVLYMLISTLSFTAVNTVVKYLAEYSTYEITFFRCVGSLFLSMGFLLFYKIPILGTHRKLLVMRGVFGVMGMIAFFASFKFIPFGTAVSIRYLAPIFAAILAVWLLKEKIKPIQWFCFMIAFAGVVLIKGIDLRISMIGLSLALVAAFLTAIVFFLIRKIGEREHSVVIVNYFMFTGTLMGGILMIPDWITPKGVEWIWLASMGLFGFFGQLYMTKAFQIAETNTVAPLKYLEAMFAIIVGWIWFGEYYTFGSLLGIGMILGGMLMNVVVKEYGNK